MRLLIAGGGTGGHLFPGVAVAEALRARDAEAAVLFVGTRRGIEARVLPELGWPVAFIDISGIKTVGTRSAIQGMARIPRALWQARRLIGQFGPDVVIGVGGYASGPVVLMARLMGLPTAILEQNSIPGLTNKILGQVAHTVFVSFADSQGFFPAGKVVISGNPIRRDIATALAAAPAAAANPAAEPRILVFGGSQGAVAVNQLVCEAAALLAQRGVGYGLVHQTGAADLAATQERYRAAGIAAECRGFIRDMAAEYRRADLIIARAGATTVAELGVVGRPAILIPYPYAAADHQTINARMLERAGAACVLDQAGLTATRLADVMAQLVGDPDTRRRMGSAMKALGRPQAAAIIVDWCTAHTARGTGA